MILTRENRIKTLRYGDAADWSGTNTFSATTTSTIYSKAINGEILDVEWNFNRAGSMALSISGTSLEFWRRNAPSGADWQSTPPRQLTQGTTGSAYAAQRTAPFNVGGEPIVLTLGSALSGTASFSMNIKYR